MKEYDLSTFEGREKYGKEAVDKTIECFIRNGILFKTLKGYCKYKKWDKKLTKKDFYKLDKKYGDVFIYFKQEVCHSFDIKRSSFSVNSLSEFKGCGFIIWDHYLTEAYIYKLDTLMKIFYNKEIPKVQLSSKDLGIKYIDFYNKNYERINLLDIMKNS